MTEANFFKRNLFITCFVGLVLGVCLRNFFEIQDTFAYLFILISAGLFIFQGVSIFFNKNLSRTRVLFLFFAFGLFFFACAIFRYNNILPQKVAVLEKHLGQEVLIEGIIDNFPEKRPAST